MRQFLTLVLLFGTLSLQAQADALRDLCLRLLAEEPEKAIAQGGIIGIYYQDSSYFYSFPNADSTEATDVFEIGANSKLFTIAILDSLVRAGALHYADSLSEYLSGPLPKVTLADLAAHRTGLALFPDNIGPYSSAAGQLQDYPTTALFDFLEEQHYDELADAVYEHSHTGYELLRLALESATGQAYERLLEQYVLEPLALKRTFVALPDSLNLEPGHSLSGYAVPQRDYRYFQGALGLRSSAKDVLAFLRQQLELPWLEEAYIKQALPPNRRNKFFGGYGWTWFWPRKRYHRVFISSGMTRGHRAYLLMVPKDDMAVVVLSRQTADIHDVPLRILEHLSYGWKK